MPSHTNTSVHITHRMHLIHCRLKQMQMIHSQRSLHCTHHKHINGKRWFSGDEGGGWNHHSNTNRKLWVKVILLIHTFACEHEHAIDVWWTTMYEYNEHALDTLPTCTNIHRHRMGKWMAEDSKPNDWSIKLHTYCILNVTNFRLNVFLRCRRWNVLCVLVSSSIVVDVFTKSHRMTRITSMALMTTTTMLFCAATLGSFLVFSGLLVLTLCVCSQNRIK